MWTENEKIGLRWLCIFVLLASFIYVLWPLLTALFLGGVGALALNPMIEKIMSKRQWSKTKSVFILMSIFTVALFLPTLIFLYKSTKTIVDLKSTGAFSFDKFNFASSQFMQWQKSILSGLESRLSFLGLDLESLQNYAMQALGKAGQFAGNLVVQFFAQLPALTLAGLVIFASTIYFLMHSEQAKKITVFYSFTSEAATLGFMKTLQDICNAILVSNLAVGFLQGLIVALGSLFFSVGDFWVVFFVTFVCSFIPIVGAAPVAVVLAIYAFSTGSIGSGIGLAITAAIAGVADNILRPLLFSGRAEVPAALGLVSIVGAVIMFGLPGLFLGPLIASVTYYIFVGLVFN
ncbi:MAG: AI-2E family transporter [Pseudobdellovibrionaceae bacterium]